MPITGYNLIAGPGPVEIVTINFIVDAIVLFVILTLLKYKIEGKKFIFGIFLVFACGLLSDNFIFLFSWLEFYSFILVAISLFILNFLIGIKYFKLTRNKSIVFGITMMILTNPLIAFLLGLFLPQPTNDTWININVLDLQCKDGRITIIVSNDGTQSIKDSELLVMIDGVIKSDSFNFSPDPIPPHYTAIATSSDIYELDTNHTVIVAGPSNSMKLGVLC
jgi:hypothetical protein